MPVLKLTRVGELAPWTKTPNFLIDKLLPELKDTELRLLLVLLRRTVGWNRGGQAVTLSYAVLQERTGRSSEAIARALRGLERRGVIHILRPRRLRNAKEPASQSEGQHYIEKR